MEMNNVIGNQLAFQNSAPNSHFNNFGSTLNLRKLDFGKESPWESEGIAGRHRMRSKGKPHERPTWKRCFPILA